MKTYLDMDEILRHCRRYIGQEYDEPYLVSAVPEEVIRSLPPADVVEVRHGRWMSMNAENEVVGMDYDGCPVNSCCCSECGDWLVASDEYWVRGRYCPNCGAKMDGEKNE